MPLLDSLMKGNQYHHNKRVVNAQDIIIEYMKIRTNENNRNITTVVEVGLLSMPAVFE